MKFFTSIVFLVCYPLLIRSALPSITTPTRLDVWNARNKPTFLLLELQSQQVSEHNINQFAVGFIKIQNVYSIKAYCLLSRIVSSKHLELLCRQYQEEITELAMKIGLNNARPLRMLILAEGDYLIYEQMVKCVGPEWSPPALPPLSEYIDCTAVERLILRTILTAIEVDLRRAINSLYNIAVFNLDVFVGLYLTINSTCIVNSAHFLKNRAIVLDCFEMVNLWINDSFRTCSLWYLQDFVKNSKSSRKNFTRTVQPRPAIEGIYQIDSSEQMPMSSFVLTLYEEAQALLPDHIIESFQHTFKRVLRGDIDVIFHSEVDEKLQTTMNKILRLIYRYKHLYNAGLLFGLCDYVPAYIIIPPILEKCKFENQREPLEFLHSWATEYELLYQDTIDLFGSLGVDRVKTPLASSSVAFNLSTLIQSVIDDQTLDFKPQAVSFLSSKSQLLSKVPNLNRNIIGFTPPFKAIIKSLSNNMATDMKWIDYCASLNNLEAIMISLQCKALINDRSSESARVACNVVKNYIEVIRGDSPDFPIFTLKLIERQVDLTLHLLISNNFIIFDELDTASDNDELRYFKRQLTLAQYLKSRMLIDENVKVAAKALQQLILQEFRMMCQFVEMTEANLCLLYHIVMLTNNQIMQILL